MLTSMHVNWSSVMAGKPMFPTKPIVASVSQSGPMRHFKIAESFSECCILVVDEMRLYLICCISVRGQLLIE